MTSGQITARTLPGDPGSPPSPKLSALGPEVPCAQAEIGPMVHICLSNPSQAWRGWGGLTACLAVPTRTTASKNTFERRGFLSRAEKSKLPSSSVFKCQVSP